ncbi:MAG: hypothetical protein ACXU9A_19325 [Xanthobacteraceae bacterium]
MTEVTRERVSREFDNLGPDACVTDIAAAMRRHNPELLDMAQRCAADLGAAQEPMVGLAMFYRLLVAEAAPELALPRVSRATRDAIVREIDDKGAEGFTFEALDEMERANPELLQMAHGFASRQRSYLGMMQGFALIYATLSAQSAADRAGMH